MKLLVVSLVLPYTIDFETESESDLSPLNAGPPSKSDLLHTTGENDTQSNLPPVRQQTPRNDQPSAPSLLTGLQTLTNPGLYHSTTANRPPLSAIPDLMSSMSIAKPLKEPGESSVTEVVSFHSKDQISGGVGTDTSFLDKHYAVIDDIASSKRLPIVSEYPLYPLGKPSGKVSKASTPSAMSIRTTIPYSGSRQSSPAAPTPSIVEPRKALVPPAQPSVRIERRKSVRPRRGTLSSPSARAYIRPLSSGSNVVEDGGQWNITLQSGGNGGLRNAVRKAQEDSELEVKWVGTLGIPTDDLSDSKKQEIATVLESSRCNNLPVFVADATFDGHYTHYCKQILWPTLHYEVPDNPKSKAYEDHSWEHYRALNQAIADKIVDNYEEDAVIWVNDYHLLLVPQMVRQKLPKAKIAFFLHIPFPSSEVFRCLATRKKLLEGMLGANCIGFQIQEYARHFLQTTNRILASDTETDGVWHNDRFVSVIDISIGIDPSALDKYLTDPTVLQWRHTLEESWPKDEIKLIVSRDKLDHIKGIKEKLLAYEEFLRQHPEMISKVVLIQVCMSDVSDLPLEQEISHIVDRINSMKRDLAAHMPVVFYHQDIAFEQYMALLAEADAFAVTSLREGMNLTCHEFIYCNDPKNMGPLILSEFTGSASVLGGQVILVNPWDKMEMADAFYKAVTMKMEEKQVQWSVLYNYVSSHTCLEWIAGFLAQVEDSWQVEQDRNANKARGLDMEEYQLQYQEVKKGEKVRRIFFLDLDSTQVFRPSRSGVASVMSSSPTNLTSLKNSQPGSATNLPSLLTTQSYAALDAMLAAPSSNDLHAPVSAAPRPQDVKSSSKNYTSALVSPQRKISVLSELTADPLNLVYVMSRDTKDTLERFYGRVPNIGMIAENGAYLKLAGGGHDWLSFADEHKTEAWQKMVIEVLESLKERTPGVRIQVNDSSVNLYVNQLLEQDPERASAVIGECISHINDAFSRQHVRARFKEGAKVVIADLELCRVAAAKRAFQAAQDAGEEVEFLSIVTKSEEDADDAARLNEWAEQVGETGEASRVYTVSLGTRASNAQWSLGGVNSMLKVLLHLARGGSTVM